MLRNIFLSLIALLLIISLGTYAYGSNKVNITKDIQHSNFMYKGNHINVFFIHKKDCVTPVLSNSTVLKSSKSIRSFVKSNPNYVVMVNGTYFSMQSGEPLGLLVINKEMMTGDIFNRASIGIWDNKYDISRVKCHIVANKVIIDNINQPRMLSTYAIMYNSKWGKVAPKSPKYGKQVQVTNNVVTRVSANQLSIPINGYVIVGPASKLNSFKVNDRVDINIGTIPDWSSAKHIVSGGPILVRDGNIYIDTKEERLNAINGRFNRTAIGYTKNNDLIIMTVDGAGLTLHDTAILMKQFNCEKAMNLDGGGSTSLYIHGVGNKISKQARYLSNVLIIK